MEPPGKRPRVNRPTYPNALAQRISGTYRQTDAHAADEPAESASRRADLLLIVRPNGQVLFCNQELGKRSAEEVVGSSVFDWIFPVQHELFRNCLDRVVTTRHAQNLELTGIRHHDPDAWYDCRISPDLRKGAVTSVTIVAHDVTRHKQAALALHGEHHRLKRLVEEQSAGLEQAQAALAEEKAGRGTTERILKRFRKMMDRAGEAIFVSDPGTRCVVDANETACRWLRRPREDVVGKPIDALELEFPILPPEDMELQFTETRDSRRPLVLSDGQHRRYDGSTFPVEVAVARHAVGEHDYVLAVVRDAKDHVAAEGDLRESKAQYETLFEQSWDAIYLTTRTGKITAGNRAALDLFDYQPDEFEGLDARALFPQPDDIRRFQRDMAAHGAVERLEVELTTKRGDRFRAYFSATRRPSSNGKIDGYQCVVRPVEREAVAGEHPEATPEAADRPADKGGVLLVEADAGARSELYAALVAAGIRVFTAETPADGVELFREHAGEIAATVLGATLGAWAWHQALEEFRQLDPDAHIVVVSPADAMPEIADTQGLGVTAVLQQPVHPLALLQELRAILPPPQA